MSGIDLRRSNSRCLSDERRVIFPSLYTSPIPREHPADEIKQTSKHHHTHSPNSPLPRSQHTPPSTDNIIVHVDQIRGMNIKESEPKQFTAATAPQISPRGPVIERSNSLDDLLISLPNLSLSSNNISINTQSEKHTIMPTNSKGTELRNEQTKVEHQRAVNRSIFQPRWPLGTPTNCNGHKTFYPAASVPIYHEPKVINPGRGGLSNNECKPPPSILRSKCGRPSSLLSSESGVAKTLTTDEEMIISTPQQTEISLATQNQLCLSPDMPTLASPTSIKTLSPTTRSNAGNDTLNESEVVQRISDMPKLLPKPKRATIKRNQSDTAVCKKEGGERQRLRKLSEGSESDHEQQKKRTSRHPSFECLNDSKKSSVGFDPHIWIYEYKPQWTIDELWFSDDELTEFKQQAIQRVRLRSAANKATVIPTGTGRVVEVPSATGTHPGSGQSANKSKAVLFNHPALSCDDEMDNDEAAEKMIQDAVSREIRNVLLVDHEIFLALFTKSLKYMLGPHISITTARSGEEAITRIEGCRKAFPLRDGGSLHGFDLILVEERLGSFPVQSLASFDKQSVQSAGDDSVQRRTMKSGSALIRSIAQEEQNFIASGGERGRCALLIGVSARFNEDQDVLSKSGADIIWAKPPPKMDQEQRNHLLKVLMKKRGREMLNIFD